MARRLNQVLDQSVDSPVLEGPVNTLTVDHIRPTILSALVLIAGSFWRRDVKVRYRQSCPFSFLICGCLDKVT